MDLAHSHRRGHRHRVCSGTVVHRRLAVPSVSPARRRHAYGLYMLLVDLESAEAEGEARAAGYEGDTRRLPEALVPRWLPSSLLGRSAHPTFQGEGPLSSRVRAIVTAQFGAKEAGRASGPVFLLSVPSVFLLSFNPVSMFFLYGKGRRDGGGGDLLFVVLEVHNTPWDESRAYALKPKRIRKVGDEDATDRDGRVAGEVQKRYTASWDKDVRILRLHIQTSRALS